MKQQYEQLILYGLYFILYFLCTQNFFFLNVGTLIKPNSTLFSFKNWLKRLHFLKLNAKQAWPIDHFSVKISLKHIVTFSLAALAFFHVHWTNLTRSHVPNHVCVLWQRLRAIRYRSVLLLSSLLYGYMHMHVCILGTHHVSLGIVTLASMVCAPAHAGNMTLSVLPCYVSGRSKGKKKKKSHTVKNPTAHLSGHNTNPVQASSFRSTDVFFVTRAWCGFPKRRIKTISKIIKAKYIYQNQCMCVFCVSFVNYTNIGNRRQIKNKRLTRSVCYRQMDM